jgi:hypothetical protein
MMVSHNTVLPPQFSSYEEYAIALVQFLQKYEYLFNLTYYENVENEKSSNWFTLTESTDNYERNKLRAVNKDKVVLFFVNNHWNSRVPEDWRNYMNSLRAIAVDNGTEDELFQFLLDIQYGKLDRTSPFIANCPDSLLDFLETARELNMTNPFSDEDITPSEDIKLLDKIIQVGMKPKKKHEIAKLGQAVVRYANETNCPTVVDLGAGQGYLSQYIAFCCNSDNQKSVNVIAIDGNELQTTGCQKRVDNIKTMIDTQEKSQKIQNTNKDATVHAVTAHLSLTITQDEFIDLLKPYLSNKTDSDDRILLIGLHTCGDLATTLVKLFLKTSAVALVNAGCCYHKLSENPDYLLESCTCSSSSYGYPMSALLSTQQNKVPLSTGSYLASNGCPEFSDLTAAKYMFKMHSYRAALESFLYDKIKPEFPESHFCGCIRPQHTTSFSKYALQALKRMQSKHDGYKFYDPNYRAKLDEALLSLFANGEQPLLQELSEYYFKLNPMSGDIIHEVQCFTAIRTALSPVVEALILVDRLLYLREQEIVENANLVRLFHPGISPRGVILTAKKK